MTNTYIDLQSDIAFNGPLIPFLDYAPLAAPGPSKDAVEHWRFGVNASSRFGLLQGLRMRLGLAMTSVTPGSGYTSGPAVALAGAGSPGLTSLAEINGNPGGVYSTSIGGQPVDDTSPVTATLSGGGGTGAAATLSRGVEPTYNPYSAVLAAGRQNGLITSIDDSLNFTERYLVKRPALGSVQFIGGTGMFLSGTRGQAVGGDKLFWAADNKVQSNSNEVAPPTSWVPGAWGVVVRSVSPAGVVTTLFGPDGTFTTMTEGLVLPVSSPLRKRVVGGIHWDTGTQTIPLEISSYAIWASALSSDAIQTRALSELDYARANGLF